MGQAPLRGPLHQQTHRLRRRKRRDRDIARFCPSLRLHINAIARRTRGSQRRGHAHAQRHASLARKVRPQIAQYYSTTPLLHYSTTPLLHYSCPPAPKSSSPPSVTKPPTIKLPPSNSPPSPPPGSSTTACASSTSAAASRT